MDDKPEGLILKVVFYRSANNHEPVRAWLKDLDKVDRQVIGEDIKTVQFGWPLGMPLVRKMKPKLWEVRSHTKQGIARILFTVVNDVMVLLHGFIKKSIKTPPNELETAEHRLAELEN